MIADELALHVAAELAGPGKRVLDPFCGTSRTLMAAAAQGASCVGIDVNPLARVISRAKSCRPNLKVLERVCRRVRQGSRSLRGRPLDLEPGRRVSWFSFTIRKELTALLHCLNGLQLYGHELRLVAAVLSATVREVSFCRDDQWKLHRLSLQARQDFFKSPYEVFRRRLLAAVDELRSRQGELLGSVTTVTGDARDLVATLHHFGLPTSFDLVVTSPPYGDSRTTVQYGAMSAISLGVLRHLDGLNLAGISGAQIDGAALGGVVRGSAAGILGRGRSEYWAGGSTNQSRKRVEAYLGDLDRCCEGIAAVTRAKGRAVVVVGRRLVGGWRLQLNHFVVDAFGKRAFHLESSRVRRIVGKVTPVHINSQARARGHCGPKRVITMREEHILTLIKE